MAQNIDSADGVDVVSPSSLSSGPWRFRMLEMIILEDTISYTFMSRNKKFVVDVEAEKLQGTSNHLVDKLLGFIGTNMDDHPDAEMGL